MKITKTLFFLLLFTVTITAQKNQIRIRTFSFVEQSYNFITQKWGEWSEAKKMSIIIDVKDDKVTFYTEKTSYYFDIITADKEFLPDDRGGKIYNIKCVTSDGLRCTVKLEHTQSGTNLLYVIYPFQVIVYGIEIIK